MGFSFGGMNTIPPLRWRSMRRWPSRSRMLVALLTVTFAATASCGNVASDEAAAATASLDSDAGELLAAGQDSPSAAASAPQPNCLFLDDQHAVRAIAASHSVSFEHCSSTPVAAGCHTNSSTQRDQFGWVPASDGDLRLLDSSRCDIERVNAADLSADAFFSDFNERKPVILRFDDAFQATFRRATSRAVLEHCFGNHVITLSTANKDSYTKYESTVSDYLEHEMVPQDPNRSGVDTKYHFGDHRHASEWGNLMRHYRQPSLYIRTPVALSFGFAGSGTGVPFHTHGHVFAEPIHGSKRWFLAAPTATPRFHGNQSVFRWLADVLPTYDDRERSEILECVVRPGEMLYLPGKWHHATLNIGESVFMSAFV